jgi:Fe-S cluster biogenesis protein NfuA
MSETAPKRRIRAQASARDPDVMGFVLDDAIAPGRTARFDTPGDASLPRALFDLKGVARVEVSDATIWIKKNDKADWPDLKPAIAAAIRQVLDATDAPLGHEAADQDPDTALLKQVAALLDAQVNPAVAAHGGHIEVEKVKDRIVHLRMSGGCQGCAASAATLRDGVERMLRAALPQIRDIEDVTDHGAGDAPYYSRQDGPSPMLDRPVPPGVIDWQDGQIMVDPDYLAPRLGLTPETLHAGLQNGDVVGVTETGQGADEGKTRIVLRSATRAWAAEVRADGSAREIPPPRSTGAAADKEQDLARQVRTHLEELDGGETPITYGALARALGLWLPGSVNRVTRALEITMQEDAAAGRPFIAAHVVSRARDGLPGQGFFDQARHLSRGPEADETDRDFHIRETSRLTRTSA